MIVLLDITTAPVILRIRFVMGIVRRLPGLCARCCVYKYDLLSIHQSDGHLTVERGKSPWNLKACDWQQAKHRRIERGLQSFRQRQSWLHLYSVAAMMKSDPYLVSYLKRSSREDGWWCDHPRSRAKRLQSISYSNRCTFRVVTHDLIPLATDDLKSRISVLVLPHWRLRKMSWGLRRDHLTPRGSMLWCEIATNESVLRYGGRRQVRMPCTMSRALRRCFEIIFSFTAARKCS